MGKKKAEEILQTQLRELIETDRVQMIEYVSKHMKWQLERFLEARKPNKTIYDVYKAPFGPPDGIREATTYDEAYEALGWQRSSNVVNRPAFDVVFKPDADEAIRRLAVKEVEMMVQTFVNRALAKLLPVVEQVPGGKMTKQARHKTAFVEGAWVGYIGFEFTGGMKFMAEMKVIQNRSKHGKLFAQYPMTFYEATLPANGDFVNKNAASIEDIWASIGYVPPPPPPRPRWSKLVPGCVVIHEGQRHFISTPGVAKKLGIPQDAEQIARIEIGSMGCWIEHADGRKESYKFTPEEDAKFDEIGRQQSYNKEAEAKRQFAYKKFFPEEAR